MSRSTSLATFPAEFFEVADESPSFRYLLDEDAYSKEPAKAISAPPERITNPVTAPPAEALKVSLEVVEKRTYSVVLAYPAGPTRHCPSGVKTSVAPFQVNVTAITDPVPLPELERRM